MHECYLIQDRIDSGPEFLRTPGSNDSTDPAQIEELITLGELTKSAWDMKEGIIAARIAAHAADIAKGILGARDWENQMSAARADVNFPRMMELTIDPEKARRYPAESAPECEDTCTMCGKMCPMKSMKKILNGEDISIH